MSLSILALAGTDTISEAAAGVGAIPAPGSYPPYSRPGFATPGTFLQPAWKGGGYSAQRTMRGAFRGYHSGPPVILPYSGYGTDDLGPSGADKTNRYLISGLAAAAIIAAVVYFTRDKGDGGSGPSWDNAFTPNALRRDLRRRKRFARAYHKKYGSRGKSRRSRDKKVGHFLSKMPTPRDLGGMSDGDSDFLREYWKKKAGKKFTSQYKRGRKSRRGRGR